jgi:hypothetical protein
VKILMVLTSHDVIGNPGPSGYGTDKDLNRAIVQCVAKMQQAKLSPIAPPEQCPEVG